LIAELRRECALDGVDEADFDEATLALADELERWHEPGADVRGSVRGIGSKALRRLRL